MSHVLRAAVAVAAAAVFTVATLAPAQAYYREAADPRGDVKAYHCQGVRGVPRLDIVKLAATSVKRSGAWRLTLTAYFAKVTSPGRNQEQKVVFNVFERGHRMGDPALVVGADRTSGYWRSSMYAVDETYPTGRTTVVGRGDRVEISGPRLKPGRTYWVAMFAVSDQRRTKGCMYRDDDNRHVTGVSTR